MRADIQVRWRVIVSRLSVLRPLQAAPLRFVLAFRLHCVASLRFASTTADATPHAFRYVSARDNTHECPRAFQYEARPAPFTSLFHPNRLVKR